MKARSIRRSDARRPLARLVKLTMLMASVSAIAVGGAAAQPASASVNASIWSGFSLMGSSGQPTLAAFSPLLGLEATYPLGVLEVGGFYTHNYLSYSDGSAGSMRFFGPVARISLSALIQRAFFDTRFGLSSSSVNGTGSSPVWAVGLGLGYRFNATPAITFSPRIALNTEPYQITSGATTTSYSQTVWDLGLLVTVSF